MTGIPRSARRAISQCRVMISTTHADDRETTSRRGVEKCPNDLNTWKPHDRQFGQGKEKPAAGPDAPPKPLHSMEDRVGVGAKEITACRSLARRLMNA